MEALIIFFAIDLVLSLLFLYKRKSKHITEKDLKKTEHDEVII